MSHVLRALQDVADGHAIPGVWLAHIGVGSLHAGVVGRVVVGRAFNLVRLQDTRDLIRPMAVDGQLVDSSNDRSCLVIHQPMVLVCRVFTVAVHAQRICRLSAVATLPEECAHLLGLFPQVHLIQHIHEWRELTADGVHRVHAVADGDEPHTLAPEVHLGIEAGLDVVAPDAAQVFCDDGSNQTGIYVCNELLPSRAFEVAAAETIICVVLAMDEAVVCRIRGQVRFL